MRRFDRQLSEERAYEVIDKTKYGILGVSSGDYPYGVPVCVVRDKDNLYFHCAKVGQKLDFIKNNDNVCFASVEYAEMRPEVKVDFMSAIAFGKASIVNDDQEKTKALNLFMPKYFKLKETFDYEMEQFYKIIHVVKIKVSQITCKYVGDTTDEKFYEMTKGL